MALIFNKYHRKLISWAISPPISVVFDRKVWIDLKRPNLVQKHTVFEVFKNKVICHIKTVIRHMWQVANGLGNAELEKSALKKHHFWASYHCSKKTTHRRCYQSQLCRNVGPIDQQAQKLTKHENSKACTKKERKKE